MTVAVAVVRPLLMLLTHRDWKGAELLPAEGFVLAANHISHADPLLLAHFVHDSGIPPRFLAKASVLDFPIIGRVLRATGQIPVYRETAAAHDALRAAVSAVRRGDCIIVYPEGTLTRDAALWPMTGKTGAAKIALTTGCPVMPVAQWGAQDILPPDAHLPRLFPRRVSRVRVGPAVDLDDLRQQDLTGQVLREGTERIMTAITRLLEGLRDLRAPGARGRHDEPETC
ncbi:lysophospholipid acyltransferase family protein [soil metagenome]